MIINHNIAALNTYRQLGNNNVVGDKSLEKLSSGLRINRAGDDAAGLAISEKMRAQIRGLDQAVRNSQDGISMIQTAEGNLNETHSILQRMRELADQAANDTNVAVDRSEIQKEINALTSEINRIGNTTEFNTQKLLDGGASANKTTLGSNEAVGIGARAAVATNADPSAVVDGGFDLSSLNDLALYVGGINDDGTVKGIKFDFSDAAKAANEDLLKAYAADDDSFEGVDFTGLKGTAKGMQLALQNLTDDSGLVKLGDLMDITVSDNGVISFASKTTGPVAEFAFAANSYSIEDGEETLVANKDLTGQLAKLGFASMNYDSEATITSWKGLHDADLTTVFKGQDGTEAVITGNKIDTTIAYGTEANQINADTAFGKKFDVTINGETYNVEIDAAAVSTGLGSTVDEAGFLATLNSALVRAVDKDDNTVDISSDVLFAATTDNEITLTMQTGAIPADGATPSLKLSGDYASTILGGITDGQNAVGGTFTAKFQIGANEGQSMQVDIEDMRAQALGIAGIISGGSTDIEGARYTQTLNVTNGTNNDSVEYSLDVSSHESATAAIKVINNAIETVSAERSKLGAYQNRLEHTINNLGTSSENLTAAESRIRDVDMAKEMMEFTKMNILSQAAQAMLAQANQQPQGVLQLLR